MLKDKVAIDIRNFKQVNSWLYRGGQPVASQYQSLADKGIKTVINLRSTRKLIETEKEIVEKLGMQFESIPMTYLNSPTYKEVKRFLQIVDDPEKRPIFVHCLHGADRTGILCGIFRMLREDWDVKDAFAEMRAGGWHQLWMFHYEFVISAYGLLIRKGFIK
ncbi:MAG: dual specificity protein phosphatase family protein [Candidatus Obscuribacterales bacterium]|nr:dual specificity protein phosphatase family protein [Candidatus Obscuribacterales bacterium]